LILANAAPNSRDDMRERKNRNECSRPEKTLPGAQTRSVCEGEQQARSTAWNRSCPGWIQLSQKFFFARTCTEVQRRRPARQHEPADARQIHPREALALCADTRSYPRGPGDRRARQA